MSSILNHVFRSVGPTWANACVGDNGNPGYEEYAEGFMASANLLIRNLIENKCQDYFADTFIYPICFNLRHAVELWLKMTVMHFQDIHKIKYDSELEFNFKQSHDIGNIWTFINSKISLVDERFQPLIDKLDIYIKDLSAIDSSGQTFRYPFDSESKKHLEEISIINILFLGEVCKKLESSFKELDTFSKLVLEEYSLGTFTKKLSRNKLFKITKMLPTFTMWKDESFNDVRSLIKKEFGLTNNDLSKAITLIKTNYEMAALIEEDVPLIGIDYARLKVFFEAWFKLHGKKYLSKIVDFTEVDFDFGNPEQVKEIFETRDTYKQKVDYLADKFDLTTIIGIKALYYFGRKNTYSEYYKREYEIWKKSEVDSIDNRKRLLHHLLEKTNAFEYILVALCRLGYSKKAALLVSDFEVDEFDWINKIVMGSSIKNNKLLCYP